MTKSTDQKRGQVSLNPAAADQLADLKGKLCLALGTPLSFSGCIEYLIGYEAGRVSKLVQPAPPTSGKPE